MSEPATTAGELQAASQSGRGAWRTHVFAHFRHKSPPDPGVVPTLLFLVVRPPGVDPDKAPAYLSFLVEQLAQISPWNAAIDEGMVALMWSEVPPGALASTADVTPTWVLAQLRGAVLEHGDTQIDLLHEGALPYALGGSFSHADILPVVVCRDWTGDAGAPVEGTALGALPYFLAVGDLPGWPLQGPEGAAFALAKALGKVLGLGEEGVEPDRLSAPDRWGRPLPNLWMPLDAAEPSPWPSSLAPAPVDGGFGRPDHVKRPTDTCLMGKPLGTDGDYCPVCADHLDSVLFSYDIEIEPLALDDVSFDPGAPSLGPVEIEPWPGAGLQQVLPEVRITAWADGSQVAPTGPATWEQGRFTVTFPGADVILRLRGQATAAGRTVVFEVAVMHTDDRDAAPKVQLHFRDPAIDIMRRSGDALSSFLSWLRGTPPEHRAPEELVTRGPGWQSPHRVQESPQFAVLGHRRDDAQLAPLPGPGGLTTLFRGQWAINPARLWPVPLQGEGGLALDALLHTAAAVRPSEGDLAGADADLLLAYLQCTGLSDRFGRLGTHTAWHVEVTDTACTWAPDPDDAREPRAAFVWSSPGVPAVLDRLGRVLYADPDLPGVHPGTGHTPRAPREETSTPGAVLTRTWLPWASTEPAPRFSRNAEGDAFLLSMYFEYLTAPGGGYFSSLLGRQQRVLEILRAWAVEERADELITACKAHGGLLDWLMSSVAWNSPGLGWADFVGRARGILFDQLGLDFLVGTYRAPISDFGLGYDLDAISRTIASLEPPHLQWAMSNPDTTKALLAGLWGGGTDKLCDVRLQFARMAEAYAQADAFAGLLDLAHDVWLDAAEAYIRDYEASGYLQALPTLAMLATIPHRRQEWREDLMDRLSPYQTSVDNGLRKAATKKKQLDFTEQAVHVAAMAHANSGYGHPLTTFAREMGALVKGARVDLARARAVGTAAEPPDDVASCEARLAEMVDAVHTQAIVDWLAAPGATAADRFEAGALLDLRPTDRTDGPGYDDGEAAWAKYRIEMTAERRLKFATFCQQTARVQLLLAADSTVVASFDTADMDKVLNAVAQLSADPITDADDEWKGDRLGWNAWATGYLCERAALASELGTDVDTALASFVRQVVRLPTAAHVAVQANRLYDEARNRLSGGSSHIEEVFLQEGLTILKTMEASRFAEGLRKLSVSAVGPSWAPADAVVNPKVFAEYLDYEMTHADTMPVQGLGDLDGRQQMRLGFVLTHRDLPGVTASDADALRAIYAEQGAVIDYAVSKWNGVDPLVGEQLRDVLFGLPRVPLLPTSPTGRALVEAEAAFLEERGRQLEQASPSNWMVEDHFSNAGPERAEAQARFEVALARARDKGTPGDANTLEHLVELYGVARKRAVAAEAAQQAIADFAAAAAVTVAAVAVSIATAGTATPLVAAALAATAGAAAGVATRVAIEGPAYTSPAEIKKDVTSAAIEGTVDVMTGGLITGAKGLMTVGRLSKAAHAGAEVVETAVEKSFARELTEAAIEGAIEGAMGGAASTLLETAMDGTTWDMSVRQSLARLGRAALSGMLFGAGFGAIGGAVGNALLGRLVDALGPDKGVAATRALTATGRPEIADELRQLVDLDPVATALIQGDRGAALLAVSDLDLSIDDQALLVDAVSRYLNVLEAAQVGHPDLSPAEVLATVRLEIVGDPAFDGPDGRYAGESARVRLGQADAASGGMAPTEIVLRRSDGAERFYEELIHSGRLQAAARGHAGPEFDDIRTVIAARENWDSLNARQKAETHAAAAREEARVRQIAIDHLDAKGTLDTADRDALGRGILGQQKADWRTELIDDSLDEVDDAWLRTHGFDEPPEFFGKRRPTDFDPVKWERQLEFYEQAPKVGNRRKLSPDPIKAGDRWNPVPGGMSTYRFDGSTSAAESQKLLAREFPNGIQYDAELRPQFAAMTSEFEGEFGAMYTATRLADDLWMAIDDLPAEFRGFVQVTLPARASAGGKFTTNRYQNFKNANERVAEILGVESWKPPEGYTWHEELDLSTCMATLVLVLTSVHSSVQHTGGVAAKKAGACP